MGFHYNRMGNNGCWRIIDNSRSCLCFRNHSSSLPPSFTPLVVCVVKMMYSVRDPLSCDGDTVNNHRTRFHNKKRPASGNDTNQRPYNRNKTTTNKYHAGSGSSNL